MARMHAIPLRYDDVFYPESDGQPMGETELHRNEIVYLIEAFSQRFEEEADVYVGGDLFFYYREGNPRESICPDVMVVWGVPKLPMRRTFQLWEEGEVPCLIVEVSSSSTQGHDFEGKKRLYEQLGIEEYFLYDPLALRDPQLQGFRLTDDAVYETVDPEPDGSLASHTTGVTLRLEGELVRAVETTTGRLFPRIPEMRKIAAQEREARLALEDEVARLRRELGQRSKT
jgi:Uma2 family endonuclease